VRERVKQCERECRWLGGIVEELDWLMPPRAKLWVPEDPSCLRPGPGKISYLVAMPGESDPVGWLFLPPLAPGEAEGRSRILDRALQAGPLGLHLPVSRAREAERRWPRRQNRSAGMEGGWVFYLRESLAGTPSLFSVEEGVASLLADLRMA
jgi:hypothetical protein